MKRNYTIIKIISNCKYGIHNISRTELDKKTNLPRFNMPFELGMFLGAKRFGDDEQKKKSCLKKIKGARQIGKYGALCLPVPLTPL